MGIYCSTRNMYSFAIEGMDKSGKTTLINNLKATIEFRLSKNNLPTTIKFGCYKPKTTHQDYEKAIKKPNHKNNTNLFLIAYAKGCFKSYKERLAEKTKNSILFTDRGLLSTFFYGFLPMNNFDIRKRNHYERNRNVFDMAFLYKNFQSYIKDELFMKDKNSVLLEKAITKTATFILTTSDSFSIEEIKKKNKDNKTTKDLTDTFEDTKFQECVRENFNFFIKEVIPYLNSIGYVNPFIGKLILVQTGFQKKNGKYSWVPENIINSFILDRINLVTYNRIFDSPISDSEMLYKYIEIAKHTDSEDEDKKENVSIYEEETIPFYTNLQKLYVIPFLTHVEYDFESSQFGISIKDGLIGFDENYNQIDINQKTFLSTSGEVVAKVVMSWILSKIFIYKGMIFIMKDEDEYVTFNTKNGQMETISYAREIERIINYLQGGNEK